MCVCVCVCWLAAWLHVCLLGNLLPGLRRWQYNNKPAALLLCLAVRDHHRFPGVISRRLLRSFDYVGLTHDTFSIAGGIKRAFIGSRSEINAWLLMYTQFLYECVCLCVSLYLGGGHQAGEEFWKGMKCQKPSSELVGPSVSHCFINYKHRSFIRNSNSNECSHR